MKRLFVFLLLIIFAGLLYISEDNAEFLSINNSNFEKDYESGILKSEISKLDKHANYIIDVSFDEAAKNIYVKENITWINKTNSPTSEIQFHLYANGYKSSKTLFGKAHPINSETHTQIDIKNILINGKKSELIYIQPEIPNPNDSTVAKVLLNKPMQPGDSIKIYFEYSMQIPRSVKRMGYATGRNFFFVSQWFPKVGVFENGKWICSQYHPYLNFYSDFGDYSVNIKVPKNYIVGATGIQTEKIEDGNLLKYRFTQSGVHDFAWFTTDNIHHKSNFYKRKDGTTISIQAFVQPERDKYFERYFQSVKNCLQYFEDNIGIYPYQNVTLVDVPRTSASGGMEYPTLFTVSAELFSPKATGWPEYLVVHEFSHQFFQGLIANNEVYEAWLDEGFTSYIATKIMYNYQSDILENFKLASYIPVFGMHFLSYNEIPMIYTLADIQIPEGTRSAVSYYRNLNIGTLSDTSYKLPTRLSYATNSYAKPELVLHSLERYLGHQTMMKILKEYYEKFKYRHPHAVDFISIVQKNANEDMTWFFDEFYKSSKSFDYKITSVNKIAKDEYEVLVERSGEGIFRNDIALYTDKDTLYKKWNGIEKWASIKFKTENEVVGAEIDPYRKNILDINFANNSYVIQPKVWASLSLAIRMFFYIQNALMILGSIG